MKNLEQKSITFQEKIPEPEKINRFSFKIVKLSESEFYVGPTYEEGTSSYDEHIQGKSMIQMATRLVKYLGSNNMSSKPFLLLECEGNFSRDEKELIRGIFKLYSSSRV